MSESEKELASLVIAKYDICIGQGHRSGFFRRDTATTREARESLEKWWNEALSHSQLKYHICGIRVVRMGQAKGNITKR